jgi:DNA repair protein RecN (Recombination protein N)
VLETLPKDPHAAEEPEWSPLAEDAALLAERVDDLSYRLGRMASGFEIDETDLEAAERRVAGYQELFRKLGASDIETLVAEGERLGRDLAALDNAASELRMRLHGLQADARELASHATKLTRARQLAAKNVKDLVESELKFLCMPEARLEMSFSPFTRAVPAINLAAVGPGLEELWAPVAEILSSHGDSGAERVTFLLAANVGEGAQPLNKVASGGELSRILLALKCALSNEFDAPTLVFDEIDAGVSGRVADHVGNKLKVLAGKAQILVVSHLAQVAAYADTHLVVSKSAQRGRTEVHIARLSKEDSAAELARLLSGVEVTDPSLANARSLMERARSATTLQ